MSEGSPEIREWPLGKIYDGGAHPLRAEATLAYAQATDDACPAYAGSKAVAPPMFHVVPFIGLMLHDMAQDPELEIDILRLVHGEHSMRFLAPLRPGTTLQVGGRLESVLEKPSGTIFNFALFADCAGERVLEGETAFFVRAASPPERKPGAKKEAPEAPPAPNYEVKQQVSLDQATRYAAASGDNNPIHLDADVAKAAGLPGVILHGLCTMALAQRDIVALACAGNPTRLAALSVRFSSLVFPGETLTLQVWDHGDGKLDFQTVNAKGKPVLVGCKAEIRA